MKIMRINTYTRTVEWVYNSMNEIPTASYERDIVKDCLEGRRFAYGGHDSDEGCMWRYVNDFPLLDSEFYFRNIQTLPSHENCIPNMLERYKETTGEDLLRYPLRDGSFTKPIHTAVKRSAIIKVPVHFL